MRRGHLMFSRKRRGCRGSCECCFCRLGEFQKPASASPAWHENLPESHCVVTFISFSWLLIKRNDEPIHLICIQNGGPCHLWGSSASLQFLSVFPIPASRTSPSAAQQEGNFRPFSANTHKRKYLSCKAAGNFRPASRIWSNTRFLSLAYVCTEWFYRTQSCFVG